MIEYDLVTYLEADATLTALLSAGTDKKIYPIQPKPGAVVPYILYAWGVGDQGDELLDEDRIQITIRSDTKLEASNVRDRVKILLDKKDAIQQTTLNTASALYFIYYSRFTGGAGFWDPATKLYEDVMFFNVKYINKI